MHLMIVVLPTWIGRIVLSMLVLRFVSYSVSLPGLCWFFNPLIDIFYGIVKQIRTNHLSGDCHYKRELLRGFLKLRGHEQVNFQFPSFNKATQLFS